MNPPPIRQGFSFQPKKATRTTKKIRLALVGVSGSGKTYTALSIAKGIGQRVLLIDTERGSASAYAEFDFDTIDDLPDTSPQTFTAAIRHAENAGYDVVILDSLSHAWMGKEGALEQVDKAAKRQQGNNFGAWRDVTPAHNSMIDAIVGSRCHIIATMRAKTEYVVETRNGGKTAPRKVGTSPVQRDGMEYEFDLCATLDDEHNFVVTKTRILELDGVVINKPGADVAAIINDWLGSASAADIAPEPYHAPAPRTLPQGRVRVDEVAPPTEHSGPIVFPENFKRHAGMRPDELTTEELRAYLKAWDQAKEQNKRIREDLYAECARVVEEMGQAEEAALLAQGAPEPAPAAETEELPKHVKRIFAVAGKAKWLSYDTHKDAWLEAINAWRLKNYANAQPVGSLKDLNPAEGAGVALSIENGVIKGPVEVVDAEPVDESGAVE